MSGSWGVPKSVGLPSRPVLRLWRFDMDMRYLWDCSSASVLQGDLKFGGTEWRSDQSVDTSPRGCM